MYHGTEITRGRRMLIKQKMEYSRGDDHWLGDGIYLYRDKFYAFRWICIMFKEHNTIKNIKSELFEKYIILKIELDYSYETTFSLTNPEHKMVFENVREQCEKKASFSNRFQGKKFTDGVVINIMFKNLRYGDTYNMVEAIFPLEGCASNDKSRTNGLDEYQLCVKDPKVIKKLIDCSFEFDIKYFDRLCIFNTYRSKHSIEYNIK